MADDASGSPGARQARKGLKTLARNRRTSDVWRLNPRGELNEVRFNVFDEEEPEWFPNEGDRQWWRELRGAFVTDDEALDKDDMLKALKGDVMGLPTVMVAQDDRKGHVQELLLVRKLDVLQLIVKYYRS